MTLYPNNGPNLTDSNKVDAIPVYPCRVSVKSKALGKILDLSMYDY